MFNLTKFTRNSKRWIRRNKRKKTDIENSNIVKKLTSVPEKEKYNGR